jgi:REP element-mobilizing transposase RayT
MRSRNRKDFEAHEEVFFITSTVVGFINIFNNKQICDVFVECLNFYQERGDFVLLAWVLMPNHFHIIIKLGGNKNISKVIGNVKRYTSRQIGRLMKSPKNWRKRNRIISSALSEPGKGTGIWKPRFDSLVINSEDILRQKIAYVHNNPVRKGLVSDPVQWRYSSASAYAGDKGIELSVNNNWVCLGYDSMPSGKDS